MKTLKRKLLGLLVTFITLFIMAVIVLLCAGLFVLPVNNYHHADGIIEYKHQYKVVSQVQGSLKELFVENDAYVKVGDTLFSYFSEHNIQEAKSLQAKLRFLYSELAILKKLEKAGSMSPLKVKEKELEISRVRYQKKVLEKCIITAPSEGHISLAIHPQYIQGAFISYGQILARLYKNREKHVKVTFPNVYSDRFKQGSQVVFRYHDPGSLKTAKLTGVVSHKHIDMETKEVHLYCNIEGNRELLEQLKPSTVVNASIRINSTSMAEDLFKISVDLSKVKKWLGINEE